MNRSTLLVAVMVIFTISLLVFAPPLAAQEKPAGKTGAKDPAAKLKVSSSTGKKVDESGGVPVIHFPEPLHDFGTIASGSKVSHHFKVVNTGDAPLRLIKAKGS